MIEYKNRTYREHLQKERWYSFTVAYKETDLWIGIDQASFQESIPTFTESRIRTLREYMDAYLQNDPDYATSLVSYEDVFFLTASLAANSIAPSVHEI